MKREAKKYTVMLLGEPYTLISDEPEMHIMQAVSRVDALMNELSESLKSKDAKRVAALAALQFAHKNLSFEEQLRSYQDELIARINRLTGS
ncbi:MAG TPA: cell division protein ZapA [Candidatus Babeliales bacterium]|nr:cell division protein ZapA [Candidatus Dependentiae bacterium]HEX2978041.1 cell division protein ZapA [Candidatus Babeliales bacterium]